MEKKHSHEHKVQQHKEEITMTHLMKADFQFYLFYIYSGRSYVYLRAFLLSFYTLHLSLALLKHTSSVHLIDGLFFAVRLRLYKLFGMMKIQITRTNASNKSIPN